MNLCPETTLNPPQVICFEVVRGLEWRAESNEPNSGRFYHHPRASIMCIMYHKYLHCKVQVRVLASFSSLRQADYRVPF